MPGHSIVSHIQKVKERAFVTGENCCWPWTVVDRIVKTEKKTFIHYGREKLPPKTEGSDNKRHTRNIGKDLDSFSAQFFFVSCRENSFLFVPLSTAIFTPSCGQVMTGWRRFCQGASSLACFSSCPQTRKALVVKREKLK